MNVPDCRIYLCLNDRVPCCSDFQVFAHLTHPQTLGEFARPASLTGLGVGFCSSF